MDTDVWSAIELYEKKFNTSFPTIPLLWGNRSDEEVIEMIDKCIAENKDVYEMGYLSLDIIY